MEHPNVIVDDELKLVHFGRALWGCGFPAARALVLVITAALEATGKNSKTATNAAPWKVNHKRAFDD